MSKRLTMPEEKSKRIAIGATVGGVLLFIILVVIIVIQCVKIGVRRRTLDELEQTKYELQQKLDQEEYDIDMYERWFYRYLLSLKMGYDFPSDMS